MSTPGVAAFPLGGRRKPKNITLLSLNANGLSNNILELTKCMSDYGIDIALIQETFLKPNRPRACTIAGYVQLRTDRTHASRGGTALYYSRSLHCCPIDIPPLINMEATGCRLAMTGHRTLIIVSVYLPSPKPLHRRDLKALLALGDAVILFGDFNCKNPRWGCPVLDYNGDKLDRLQDRLDFEIIAPPTATHFPHNRPHGGIRPSHKAFWSVTKALKTEGYTPIPPLKRLDGSTALDDAEVAECLADSIETQCSHVSPPHDPAHISRIEEEVLQKTSLEPKDDLTPVSLSEVQLLVRSLKTRKAPGLDGVSNKAIKCFPQQLLSLLVAIFNACLQNCYFPPAWKEAEVIGIHKPGKPRDLPASYRPISLLSGLAKLFERVLKTRLSDHLLGKGLIIDEQFGFRPAHSCPQQVLRVVEYILEGFKNKQKTVAVFFDVAKAFDRVWHAGLVHKLYSLQVPDRLVIIIQNYLTNRHFTFRHERTHSTRRLIRAGVPQGSALSPLLYSAYTNDIPRPTSGVQLALFADDTALYYKSRNRTTLPTIRRLQRAIDELDQWFRLWRIDVNPDKSAAIQFKYSRVGVTLLSTGTLPT
ncbi:Probable RNA-directed DNA polymerase from transposon BS [Eumeta japonica]|uniref:Probable RNA-directed DNA polymerase from transposon BS n=1 Tax=Eumeta variegata TaxID=151549 RepID=A0A4C1VCD8_EUMVA|nr:Probable RNA-directed DNA polymerase from transposon BS [Eumeta japonica]